MFRCYLENDVQGKGNSLKLPNHASPNILSLFGFVIHKVYLHGSQQFKDTWSSVLLAAGCKMVAKLPGRVDYECDVIICEDHKLPASVKHAANLLAIPIVSVEWLLQTLINGRQVPFDGHPKYDYRCKNS